MAKKSNNNGVENKNMNNDGGEMKEDGPIASKFVKWVKSFQCAESVKSEGQANKLTVVGKLDPTKLRDKLATKTKNMVDLVSPQPKKNKVNKDDANDTKKKQPEKTDNDEKSKVDPLTLGSYVVPFPDASGVSLPISRRASLLRFLAKRSERKRSERKGRYSVSGNDDNDDNDSNDGNDGNGGGSSGGSEDEKKKKEDEGNGGGKMKYPSSQSQFGQFSYGKGSRHPYGYQNGALKTGEKMLAES